MRKRLRARLARLARQDGYTLMELASVMAILGTVMGGVTTLLVSGTKAEIELNNRFQAQQEARLALDRFRREVHCASSAATATPAVSVTLTMPSTCPTAGGQTSITWCTVPNGTNRYRLWRYLGGSCSGTGALVADHLTNDVAFQYYPSSTASLAKVGLTLHVNTRPAQTQSTYKLTDDIVLRNSTRA